jgi:hypothetical protein
MVAIEADHYATKRNIQLVVEHDGFKRLTDRQFRFHFNNAKLLGCFVPGDIYILDPRWEGLNGSSVSGGADIIYYHLTLFAAANIGFSSFYTDRHCLLHVNLRRGPGRALSVNNGGNNHHNARTGPWIEGCLFENCGDDVCHVNGFMMAIAEQPKPDQLIFSNKQRYDQYGTSTQLDLQHGDQLLFFQRDTGKQIATATVTSVIPNDKTILVTTNLPIAGLTIAENLPTKLDIKSKSGKAVPTEVYNANRMCNEFVFRYNTARNNRRIGVLAKGQGGLIEYNAFENLGGGGVEFWNSPFEGLAAQQYVVQNNTIRDCGRLARKHAAIWCSLFKGGADQLHQQLLISNNEILNFPGTAIRLHDIGNSVVRDNHILLAPSLMKGKTPSMPIEIVNAHNVREDNNRIDTSVR